MADTKVFLKGEKKAGRAVARTAKWMVVEKVDRTVGLTGVLPADSLVAWRDDKKETRKALSMVFQRVAVMAAKKVARKAEWKDVLKVEMKVASLDRLRG